MNHDDIREKVRNYIKNTIVQDDHAEIDDNTPLITGGLIDSISTLKMVDFLEKEFGIEFQPHEVDRETLDNIGLITAFILSKK